VPDHVISSPAVRAISTAEKACRAMGQKPDRIQRERGVYAAGVEDLVAVLRRSPEQAARVMIVGHNPGLEELLVYLSDPEPAIPDDGKLLPTATLARLTVKCRWADLGEGCARLKSIVRPAELPANLSSSSQAAEGSRERPDYYYSQSAVIPYRWQGDNLEILVISSRKKKHWLVPKGIKEPGLTPEDSAAKEALEEAGVEGRVAAAVIGSYTYDKWGGTCSVDVYPMEVTSVLPEAEWQERYRDREWLTPEAAAARLKQAELGSMVRKLASLLIPT